MSKPICLLALASSRLARLDPIAAIQRGCQVHAMLVSPTEFGHLIEKCWSIDSASTFSQANPARGQCSVTALVAMDLVGGTIAKTHVGDGWHFYNLIDGERFDFTASQFDDHVVYDDMPSGREDALADTTERQYRALTEAVWKASQLDAVRRWPLPDR